MCERTFKLKFKITLDCVDKSVKFFMNRKKAPFLPRAGDCIDFGDGHLSYVKEVIYPVGMDNIVVQLARDCGLESKETIDRFIKMGWVVDD